MKTGVMLLAGSLLLAGCKSAKTDENAAAQPSYVKVHDIKQLMATVVQPQADVFWKSSGSVTDETGTHELTPTTDDGWLRTRSAAATVTEMGNLLQTPLYAEGRMQDWIGFSKALVEIGKRAEKAAADKNSDAMFEVGATMYDVCTACHQIYPPKAGEIPADNATAAQPK